MSESFDANLVSCCGNNCGTCVAFFGYTMTGKNGSMYVVDGAQGLGCVHSSKRSARNWQLIKFSTVLNVQIFRV